HIHITTTTKYASFEPECSVVGQVKGGLCYATSCDCRNDAKRNGGVENALVCICVGGSVRFGRGGHEGRGGTGDVLEGKWVSLDILCHGGEQQLQRLRISLEVGGLGGVYHAR